MFFSRESKYEIRVLRVVACVREFLYTVTQKMRAYKRKLAKMTKKMAKIRPDTANGRYGRYGRTAVTAEWPPPKKKTHKIGVSQCGFT